jgi:hypothetical protein
VEEMLGKTMIRAAEQSIPFRESDGTQAGAHLAGRSVRERQSDDAVRRRYRVSLEKMGDLPSDGMRLAAPWARKHESVTGVIKDLSLWRGQPISCTHFEANETASLRAFS